MKPLVRASTTNLKFTRSAVSNIIVLAIFGALSSLLFLVGDPIAVVIALVLVIPCVAGVIAWIRRMRRATGSAPVLSGEQRDDGLYLKTPIRGGSWTSRRSNKATTIPPGQTLWCTEEQPDSSTEFLVGVQPYRYWLAGEGVDFAIGSYSRLTRADLAELEAAFAGNGNTVHWLFERTAEDGPLTLAPVSPGAPASVTIALPDGAAVLGAYSDRGTAGWVPREQAYATPTPLPLGGHGPASVTFGVDRIDATGWLSLPGVRLAAYADTVVLATRRGVPQLVVRCPAGFSVAYVLRAAGPQSNRLYVHLDGAPPPA